MIDNSLKDYIEQNILPMYIGFDAAHQLDHVNMVISQSFEIAKSLDVDENLTYAVAAYHDVGLAEGDRELHHVYSAKFVLNDNNLKRWFSPENIKVMSEAVEDHRASSVGEPRSIYGKIVADADRYIEPEMIIKRAIQYGITNYPALDREQQYLRTLQHMNDKYSDCGYLKLWFPDSPNAKRLETLRCIIRDEMTFRNIFENLYSKLIKDMPILNEHNKHEYPPMHTAEHILNGEMARRYSCGRAFSAHVERTKSKLDYHLSQPLTDEEIECLEAHVNSVIIADVVVYEEFISQSEAVLRFDLSRLPEGASEVLRVVHVGNYDQCLCAGTHVSRTSEIGKFRISSSRWQNGVQRLVFRLD